MVYVGTQSGNYTAAFDVGNTTYFVFPDARPGQLYYVAVAAYALGPLVGSLSEEVSGYSNAPPVLTNPGSQTGTVGQFTTLQLAGSDPDGQPVSYAATALPPGLAITNSTGLISGTPSAAGVYNVMATVWDGVLSDMETFTWTVAAPVSDVTAPLVTVTSPTSDNQFTSTTEYTTLGGTAADDSEVTLVRWSNDRGWSGRATGTSTWVAGVPLKPGWNTISVEAVDRAGNIGRRTVMVHTKKR
jgi:hypothetical protein